MLKILIHMYKSHQFRHGNSVYRQFLGTWIRQDINGDYTHDVRVETSSTVFVLDNTIYTYRNLRMTLCIDTDGNKVEVRVNKGTRVIVDEILTPTVQYCDRK